MKSFIEKQLEKKTLLILLLFFSLQIPSVRALFKYIPSNYQFIILIYGLLNLTFYVIIVSSNITRKKFFTGPFLAVILILLIFIVNYFVYPIADSLKYQGKGSDSDDAIIVVTRTLLSGHSPFAVKTYLNNYIDNGPGIIFILAPFVILKAYYLATPVFVLLLSYLFYRKYKVFGIVNIFLLLVISSPAFWELMVNGSDLLIIGILMIIPILLWDDNLSPLAKLLLIFLIALTMTSRVVFLYLAPVYGFILAGNSPKHSFLNALKLTFILFFFTIALHSAFFLPDPANYGPFHLLSTGTKIIFTCIFFISILPFAFIAWFTIILSRKGLPEINMFLMWIWIALPMLVITIISFNFNNFNIRSYPFTYLGLQIPIIASFYIIKVMPVKAAVINGNNILKDDILQ